MKIGIGLSGGVDSGTSALVLKEKGYILKGYTMFLFDSQEKEIESAATTAKQLGIEHCILDFRKEFKKEVIDKLLYFYKIGFTPNPCLFCNKSLKYGKMIDIAIKDGMDGFAMGHYAKKVYDEKSDEYKLLKADDERKDQSYNLYNLNQNLLKFLQFPAGDFKSKEDLRKKAEEEKLKIAGRKDSTGICFLGEKTMKAYLRELNFDLNKPGNIVDLDDSYLGRHNGLFNYTIGQKKNLPAKNMVVVDIDTSNNKLILGTEAYLFKNRVFLNDVNFISDKASLPLKVNVKLSQWSPEFEGVLIKDIDNSYYIDFPSPVRAPAPGQAAVFYIDDMLIGGGTIIRTE